MAIAPRLLAALLGASLAFATVTAPAWARGTRRLEARATTTIWWLDADTPPPGSSKGDAIFGSDTLRHGGALVGRSHWRLVYETPALAVLTETAYLADGTITCRGEVRAGARRNSLRVVRGSGAYRGATGVCTTRAASSTARGATLKRYELVVR